MAVEVELVGVEPVVDVGNTGEDKNLFVSDVGEDELLSCGTRDNSKLSFTSLRLNNY